MIGSGGVQLFRKTVAMTDTFAQAFLPEAELFAVYALLIVVMIFRPQGLFGSVGRAA